MLALFSAVQPLFHVELQFTHCEPEQTIGLLLFSLQKKIPAEVAFPVVPKTEEIIQDIDQQPSNVFIGSQACFF